MSRNGTVQAFLECTNLPFYDERVGSVDLTRDSGASGSEAESMIRAFIATVESDSASVPKPVCLSSYAPQAKLQGMHAGLSDGVAGAPKKRYDYLGGSSLVFALRPVKSIAAEAGQNASRQQPYFDWFCWLSEKKSWLTIGFSDSRLRYRSAPSNIQHELLLRAIRGRSKPQEQWSVFDATAGLARDAWLMAAAGYRVDAIERVALLSTMLGQSLLRHPQSDIAANLSISAGDSVQIMAEKGDSKYDIVYLDPMYDTGLKSTAAVKNEMFFLRQLSHWFKAEEAKGTKEIGTPSERAEQSLDLLELARCVARRKVVVKRAPKAPYLAGVEPASSLTAKAVRFDIYPC